MRRAELLVAACVLAAAGCQVDPYCVDCHEGGADAMPADASADGDATLPMDGGPDDMTSDASCDGIDFMTNLHNCGGCHIDCAPPGAFGVCTAGMCGIASCDVGFVDLDHVASNGCEYRCTAVATDDRICDMHDDDCDGMIDEDVNVTTDPMNCGSCGHACTYAHGMGSCTAMTCSLAGCDAGFIDLDHSDSNGCEYACTVAGMEICNGRDDDCNGMVDEGVTPPAFFCNANGVCAGTTPTCNGTAGWVCVYPSTYETVETLCDGLDNDCDGMVDEAQPLKGTACSNGTGACRTTGTYVCTADGSTVMCNAAAAGTPGTETCNGLDDDCDGAVDETRASPGASPSFVVDSVVQVATSLWVMQYEAVRPDATATVQGGSTARACSRSGAMPWTNVTYPQAVAACTAAGMRLCTEAEWQSACQAGGTTCTWSYSSACTTYAPNTCNGNDYDTDAVTPGDQDAVLATGSMASCYANVPTSGSIGGHVFDMSGNVKEWATARSAGINPMRGGATNNTQNGIRCDFNFPVANDTFLFDDVGFRCCSSTAP